MIRTARQTGTRQLALPQAWARESRPVQRPRERTAPLCAGCRAHEARYGFRDERIDPPAERPRTLCFECFRMELDRRQAVAAQRARGWDAEQAPLPLEDTLRALTQRRRRAQIAARRAVGE